jgi:hypothetical protein
MAAHRKHALSLEIYSAIYGCSTSLLKRASASGVDVSNRAEVMVYIRSHGRETTKFAVAEAQRTGHAAAIQKLAPLAAPHKPAKTVTQQDPRVILAARRAHWDQMSPAEQAKWTPEEKQKWLTRV